MSKSSIVSIIVPVYNEEENLKELYRRLNIIFEGQPYHFELLFVDDGSRDNSWACISELCERHSNVSGLSLSRNFGHQAALSAGLDHVKGEAIIMMDADLQHPPEVIPLLLTEWKEGHDVVYTVREDTKELPWLKRATSSLFYKFWNSFSGINIPAGAADFRLLSAQAAESLKGLKERTRFLRGMVGWIGFKTAEVAYKVEPRFAGKTKYSFGKMLHLSLSGMTSFTSIPLYCATVLGAIISLLSFLYGLYALYIRLCTSVVVPGWTSILVSVLFLGGIQLLAIGILGEYMAKIYEEVKGRPTYIVQDRKGKMV